MNVCKECGNQFEGNYCPNCGTKYEPITQQMHSNQIGMFIICNNCNSTNVHMQAKKSKNNVLLGCVLALGGLGLMFLGLIGAIIGVVLGLIIGVIVSALMPTQYETVAVCQNCGNSFKPVVPAAVQHPQCSTPNDSNLILTRDDAVKGTIVTIRVTIDNQNPFIMNDRMSLFFNVEEGYHQISYEQVTGIGKKKNKGMFSVFVKDKVNITFSFTRNGILYNCQM